MGIQAEIQYRQEEKSRRVNRITLDPLTGVFFCITISVFGSISIHVAILLLVFTTQYLPKKYLLVFNRKYFVSIHVLILEKIMNLFTADVGQGKVHIYDSGNDQFYGKLPQESLINLNIPGLKMGDTLLLSVLI